MNKWNMVIDCALCHDCNNCFLADKDEFVGNDFPPYSLAQPWSGHRWINIGRRERGQHPLVQVSYLPQLCMHCDKPPCQEVAPDGAVYKRDDGLVLIDPLKTKGCRELVAACPYGAIWWNNEAQIPQKCTGCAHLLDDGWTETRCSQICPTGAIRLYLLPDQEMEKIVREQKLEVLRAELGTAPRVYYKNLQLWEKVFVGASVAFADTDECAQGAILTVRCDGQDSGSGEANAYGEVIVGGLEPGALYDFTVSAEGYKEHKARMLLRESTNMGLVLLEKI